MTLFDNFKILLPKIAKSFIIKGNDFARLKEKTTFFIHKKFSKLFGNILIYKATAERGSTYVSWFLSCCIGNDYTAASRRNVYE